jgi:hypothetical protein
MDELLNSADEPPLAGQRHEHLDDVASQESRRRQHGTPICGSTAARTQKAARSNSDSFCAQRSNVTLARMRLSPNYIPTPSQTVTT